MPKQPAPNQMPLYYFFIFLWWLQRSPYSLSLPLHLILCRFPPSPLGAFHTTPFREWLWKRRSRCAPLCAETLGAQRGGARRGRARRLSLLGFWFLFFFFSTQGIVHLLIPGGSCELSGRPCIHPTATCQGTRYLFLPHGSTGTTLAVGCF